MAVDEEEDGNGTEEGDGKGEEDEGDLAVEVLFKEAEAPAEGNVAVVEHHEACVGVDAYVAVVEEDGLGLAKVVLDVGLAAVVDVAGDDDGVHAEDEETAEAEEEVLALALVGDEEDEGGEDRDDQEPVEDAQGHEKGKHSCRHTARSGSLATQPLARGLGVARLVAVHRVWPDLHPAADGAAPPEAWRLGKSSARRWPISVLVISGSFWDIPVRQPG